MDIEESCSEAPDASHGDFPSANTLKNFVGHNSPRQEPKNRVSVDLVNGTGCSARLNPTQPRRVSEPDRTRYICHPPIDPRWAARTREKGSERDVPSTQMQHDLRHISNTDLSTPPSQPCLSRLCIDIYDRGGLSRLSAMTTLMRENKKGRWRSLALSPIYRAI